MGQVLRFEDLTAWQRARELTREIYSITRREGFRQDFDLARQIRRAAVSIMSNIAEGSERQGSGELQQFLAIAKGSCAEVRCQMYIALDAGYLVEADSQRLMALADQVARITGRLRAVIADRRETATAQRKPPTRHSSPVTRHSPVEGLGG